MAGREKKQTGSLTSILFKAQPPEMIEIPEGPFLMGTSDEQVLFLLSREEWAHEWHENDLFLVEQPQHTVELPTYQIAKYPITNMDYYVFIFKTGYKLPKTWSGFQYPEEEAYHPITGIDKNDALAYINWMNKQTGLKLRFPTEAEWEKAARGTDSRIYPWGNEFDPWRCNTQENGKASTTEVGIYSPGGDSAYGVADMVGNVWEWTSSFMQPYPYNADDGREDPTKKSGNCVVRGGAWYYSRKLARCSAREGVIPTFHSKSLGFRVAMSIE